MSDLTISIRWQTNLFLGLLLLSLFTGCNSTDNDPGNGSPVNRAPVAFAGTNQNGAVGGTMYLDGTGSYDPDNDALTYTWSFQAKPAESLATLVGADTSTPSFVSDRAGTYVVALVVNDGLVSSPADSTSITVAESPCGALPPLAKAGADRNVPVGATVTLDGSSSIEPCGYPLSFTWAVLSAPSGSNPTLSDAHAERPSFTAALEGAYTLSLVVSNGVATSTADTVTITAGRIVNLPFRVIDAEYSKQLDKIVMVASMPSNQLHIYDPGTGGDSVVALALVPTSISVSPDGTHAAVGHNGWVSFIDLTTATLIKTMASTADVLDVVLAGNGYVYAFPRADQWELIRCLNIDTGAETLSTGYQIYAGTKAKLHPGGAAIYGADNGLSPADIEKYDISGGTASMLYDSPYHGDYAMCGDLWMSEDGFRIFTRCGNVFRASPNRYAAGTTPEDMIYNGALQSLTLVRHLSHSSAASMVAAIPDIRTTAIDDAQIKLFNYDYLTLHTTLPLPMFTFNGTDYVGHGRFVFYNSAGTRLYVIMMADATSGALYDYGLFVY